MAVEKDKKTKIILERTYNVPLRKDFLKAPRYKRTNRAVSSLRAFLKRHMKSDDIKIGKHLNLALWKKGIKNPPHHIKITAIKDEKGIVRAEIVGKEIELERKKKVKEEEGLVEKLGLRKNKDDGPTVETYKPKAENTQKKQKKAEAKTKKTATEKTKTEDTKNKKEEKTETTKEKAEAKTKKTATEKTKTEDTKDKKEEKTETTKEKAEAETGKPEAEQTDKSEKS